MNDAIDWFVEMFFQSPMGLQLKMHSNEIIYPQFSISTVGSEAQTILFLASKSDGPQCVEQELCDIRGR